MKKLISVLIFLVALTTITTSQTTAQSKINSGKDVIHAMHEMYEDKWYDNLTFEQETIFYGPDEQVQRTQTWYEAMKIPGRLAIKFDEKDSDNGILFRDGIQYGFADGEKIQETERVHDLLVLGFDVYRQSPDSTCKQLEAAGYDLTLFYEDEWQGREVYVIGTEEADMESPQFWIDKKRLLFVRNITIGRQNSIQEVQFNKYEKLGEGWIAPELVFLVNGQKAMLENYSQIETPDSLSDEIFMPESFLKSRW